MSYILIGEQGTDLGKSVYSFPWKSDAICYNFKLPRELVCSDDIRSIDRAEVESLVIKCNLSDYSFIADMKNLRQLYIYTGENIYDLSFIEDLVKLNHLCIGRSHIESLGSLVKLIKKKKALYDDKANIKENWMYLFDGIYIDSDSLDSSGSELPISDLDTSEVIVNRNRIL